MDQKKHHTRQHHPASCGRLVLGQGAKVLSGVAQGLVHHILEDEVDGQKEEQVDQREKDEEGEVNGGVEAIRETHNNAHETRDGMRECGPKLEPMQCNII